VATIDLMIATQHDAITFNNVEMEERHTRIGLPYLDRPFTRIKLLYIQTLLSFLIGQQSLDWSTIPG
jgi:hypothetical protein